MRYLCARICEGFGVYDRGNRVCESNKFFLRLSASQKTVERFAPEKSQPVMKALSKRALERSAPLKSQLKSCAPEKSANFRAALVKSTLLILSTVNFARSSWAPWNFAPSMPFRSKTTPVMAEPEKFTSPKSVR